MWVMLLVAASFDRQLCWPLSGPTSVVLSLHSSIMFANRLLWICSPSTS
jgi:hypothetical protein